MVNVNAVQSYPTLTARQWLLIVVAVLSFCGIVIVTSASMDIASIDNESPFFYAKRHGIFLLTGIIVSLLVYQVPMAVWERSGGALLVVSYLLLIVVLIPGLGKSVNGSTRWINVGPINIQISEIVKVCAMVYVAGYLVRRVDEIRQSFWGFMKPVIVLSLMVLLLLKQPDFGTVVVIMTAVFAMLFLAGVKLSQFLMVILGSVGAASLVVFTSEYRMNRVIGYFDPWADQYSSGYQLVQSLIAFGRGEWFGLGLGNSIQKLFYLPEAHTDFVFAILAEEFGFIGNVFVIALYVALVLIAMSIGRRAEQLGKLFNAYLVYGISILIGIQAMINVGVSSGLLPTKGLTLPFISYGGSSLIITFLMVSLVMRADYENSEAVRALQSKKQSPKSAVNARVAKTRNRREPVV